MTRHIPFTMTCCASLAAILAAASGSPTAALAAGAFVAGSVTGTAVLAPLHWRRKRHASTRCPWCKDTSAGPQVSDCICTTACEEILWCRLNVTREVSA